MPLARSRVVLVGRDDYDRVERQLRELLTSGQPIGDALRELHGPRGVGLLLLYPAVEAVCGLTRREAMKLAVRETLPLRYP
jgi:hypothetical protein